MSLLRRLSSRSVPLYFWMCDVNDGNTPKQAMENLGSPLVSQQLLSFM